MYERKMTQGLTVLTTCVIVRIEQSDTTGHSQYMNCGITAELAMAAAAAEKEQRGRSYEYQ